MKTYLYAGSALALLTIIGALGVSQVRPSVAPPPLASAGTSAPDAPTSPDVQAARMAAATGAGSARSNPALPADPDALPADLPLQLASVSGPAGTPQQACRVADMLSRCAQRQQLLGVASGLTRVKDRAALGGALRYAESIAQGAEKTAACESLTAADLEQIYPLKARAADGLGLKAQRDLINNPHLPPPSEASRAAWQDYNSRSAAFLARALAERRREDLYLLVVTSGPMEVPLQRPPYIAPDKGRFLALFEAAQRAGVALPPGLSRAAEAVRRQMSGQDYERYAVTARKAGGAWRDSPAVARAAASTTDPQPRAMDVCGA